MTVEQAMKALRLAVVSDRRYVARLQRSAKRAADTALLALRIELARDGQ